MGVALSSAWASPDVKGDLEQWEGLCEGSGNPWGDHGPRHKKTVMGDDVLVLRTHVAEWGVEAA